MDVKYRVLFDDGDILRDEEGMTEFSKQRADYFVYRLAGHASVNAIPFQRHCRWCMLYHPYLQDGCEIWPAVLPPEHPQHTILNLGVVHKPKRSTRANRRVYVVGRGEL